ncbi:MAG: hypothetical protein IJW75_01995 [Alphaproteobacteria bacterium]|nr:hypothetical protein [Alphaproteobacteria bacterium]
MGTLLKYLFYIFLIIVIYLLGVGFYEGTINKDSTIKEVASDVTEGTKEIVKDGYDTTKKAIDNAT